MMGWRWGTAEREVCLRKWMNAGAKYRDEEE